MLGVSSSPAPPAGVLSATTAAAPAGITTRFPCSSFPSHLKLTTQPKATPFLSKTKTSRFNHPSRRPPLTVANAAGGEHSAVPATKPPPSSSSASFSDDIVSVGQESVPLEGVIQFDKPDSSSRVEKWGRIALLSGGDALALLLFASIGRFTHGFSVFDVETLRTADPFIAGWFFSAYFLGGYGKDGRGMNGLTKAVTVAAKSWALGIPLGVGIRALTLGHLPPINFITVTMGSTAVLLISWRAFFFRVFGVDRTKDDVYRRGSPFELFELLTSLVRRW